MANNSTELELKTKWKTSFCACTNNKKKEGFSLLQIRVSQLLRFFSFFSLSLVHVTFRLAFNYCRKVNNVMFNQRKKSEYFFLFSHPFSFSIELMRPTMMIMRKDLRWLGNEAISSFNLKPFIRSFNSWKFEPRNQVKTMLCAVLLPASNEFKVKSELAFAFRFSPWLYISIDASSHPFPWVFRDAYNATTTTPPLKKGVESKKGKKRGKNFRMC